MLKFSFLFDTGNDRDYVSEFFSERKIKFEPALEWNHNFTFVSTLCDAYQMWGLSFENDKGGFLIIMKVIVMIMGARKKNLWWWKYDKGEGGFYDDVDNFRGTQGQFSGKYLFGRRFEI